MKILIKGFRCHSDAEYLFRDGQLILLAGASGAGKSTVFQSIYWCMYGSMRNIYSNSVKAGKISVTIQMKECTIYRQGRPNLFRIVINDKVQSTYEDMVAQEMIDRMFGPKDLWKACCYIDQNSRCALLSGSNVERMDLLNKLSFSTDDPELCISRIDAEIKSMREKFSVEQAIFSNECSKFSQELTDTPIDVNILSLIQQIPQLKVDLGYKQGELVNLDKIRMEQMRLIGTKTSLEKSLDQKKINHSQLKQDPDNFTDNDINLQKVNEIKMKTIPSYQSELSKLRQEQIESIKLNTSRDYLMKELQVKENQLLEMPEDESNKISEINMEISGIESELSKLSLTISNMEKYTQLKMQHKMLSDKLSKSQINPDVYSGKYTMNDSWKTQQEEQVYTKNSLLCQQLGLEYNTEAISESIKLHTSQMELDIAMDAGLKILTQIRTLEQELSLIPSQDQELTITDDELLTARDEYTKLNQSADLLSCPHCGKSVRYMNSSLHPDNLTPTTPDQIKAALDRVSLLFTRQRNQKNSLNLKEQIKTLSLSCQNRTDIERYESRGLVEKRIDPKQRQITISQLQQIVVVNKPELPSVIVRDLITYDNLMKQLSEYSGTDIEGENIDNDGKLSLDQLRIQQKTLMSRKTELSQKIGAINLNSSRRNALIGTITELKTKLDATFVMVGGSINQDHTKEIGILEGIITDLTRKIGKWESLLRVEDEIKRIEQQLIEIIIIHDIEDRYSSASKEIETLKYQINACEYADRMYKRQADLELKQTNVLTMTNDLTDLQKLRQLAIDVECQQLQVTVDSINNAMVDILGNIFDDPITVRIQLHKQLKTSKTFKSAVNLYISYKGAEYDAINQMSGGEGDRISFALILALNRVSPSSLLMLDESMSSINADLRESCLQSLRESVGITKTVLIINHEDVEGHYDDVIRF